MRALPMLLALAACTDEPSFEASFITPADGQTNVAPFQILRVHGNAAKIPDDFPLPDLVEVLDLDRGGRVQGSVSSSDGQIRFTPDQAWLRGEYLWTVRQPLDDARMPEFDIDPAMLGSASFSTLDQLRVIHAAWSPSGSLCVLLSRPPRQQGIEERLRVTVDGEPVPLRGIEILTPVELGQDALDAGDNGIGGVCMELSIGGRPERARFYIDDDSWLRDLEVLEPLDMVADVRRGS